MSQMPGAPTSTRSSISDQMFLGAMAEQLSTPVGGPSEARVMSALMRADVQSLSPGERKTLMAMTRELAADGDIDHADAHTLTTLIDVMEQSGPECFAPTWPFPHYNLSNFPGNALFGGLLGAAIGMVASKMQDAMFSGAVDGLLTQCGGGFCENLVSEAFSSVDLSTLSHSERAELLGMLGCAASDGQLDSAETRALLESLNAASNGGCAAQLQSLDSYMNPWAVSETGNGTATIDLGNGYELLLDEKSSKITLINEETGEKTVIWGDPHFDANGDGKTDMDFWGTITLNLEDGTKITVNTTPWENNPNMTLSSELTITKGDQAIVVTGLDQNTVGDMQIEQLSGPNAGVSADWLTQDGLNIYENPNGEGWLVLDGIGFREVTQADMTATKNDMEGGSFDLLPGLFALSGHMMASTMWLTAAAVSAGAQD